MTGNRRNKRILLCLTLILGGLIWLGLPGVAAGNVYVTGHFWYSPAQEENFKTIGYDADGNRLWVENFNNRASGGDDKAKAIKVDADGNVYVTGQSWNGFSTDFVTIKYDVNGNRLWRRISTVPAVEDTPVGLAVDSAGNVYVSGTSDNGANYDYVTIKYNANGGELWVKSYNSRFNSYDIAKAMAVDAAGNVYITGYSYNGATNAFVTVKYDTNGVVSWIRRYSSLYNLYEEPEALAVDADGNVYVTGTSSNGHNDDWVTIKYSPTGARLWGRRYSSDNNGDDHPYAMAVDGTGNIYITGYTLDRNGDTDDYLTIKYGPDGTRLWCMRYNGPSDGTDKSYAVAVAPNGDVVVTGTSYNGTNNDFVTIKYDSATGNRLWVRRFSGESSQFAGDDPPMALAVDGAGNAYVTGSSYNDTDYVYCYVVIKYSADGIGQWKRYDKYVNGHSYPTAIAVD